MNFAKARFTETMVVTFGLLLLIGGMARGSFSAAQVKAGDPSQLKLTSTSLQRGKIPRKYTCDGEDTSLALSWSAPPPATQSLALIVTDPDAPGGAFVHWLLYNLPATKRELPEGISKEGRQLDDSLQGRNDFDEIGYRGPCPPGRILHHYVFALYALDSRLPLPAGETREQIETAMKGHMLARGELIALYEP
jgi:hypothetical protein